ncbi:unnamed protein product [Microthlaspi erraticum]|uniref:MADS-box domain-containing protein n=1 Tax=Microthlaspi erraticum TaxID=1685480 RepID=A0A6D2I4Y4_9BRAS|nr:unnamed protein product [Microthlaspi erraticum]
MWNDTSNDGFFTKKLFRIAKERELLVVMKMDFKVYLTPCAVIKGPDDSCPEVWPSNDGVQSVVSKFRALPVVEQQKRRMDQETFLNHRIAKTSEQLKKEIKEGRDWEIREVMFHCLTGNMHLFHLYPVDLKDLGSLIDKYLEDVNRRIEVLEDSRVEIGESSYAAGGPSEGLGSAPAATIDEDDSSSSSTTAAARRFH